MSNLDTMLKKIDMEKGMQMGETYMAREQNGMSTTRVAACGVNPARAVMTTGFRVTGINPREWLDESMVGEAGSLSYDHVGCYGTWQWVPRNSSFLAKSADSLLKAGAKRVEAISSGLTVTSRKDWLPKE